MTRSRSGVYHFIPHSVEQASVKYIFPTVKEVEKSNFSTYLENKTGEQLVRNIYLQYYFRKI